MSSRKPLQYPRYQAWGDDETFLNGGTITFYDAGTTNKRNIYQDADLTTTAPNPVTLNSRGEPQSAGGTAIDIYLDEQPYKIVLADSSGTTVHTIDDYIETQDVLEPKDPANATDQSTDVFKGTLNSDSSSGEIFQVDFQTANTTTTPTFENTAGSLGALKIKTRDRSALWSGALNGVHELQYDGTDYLVLDPFYGSQDLDTDATVVFRGYDPEHTTDSGTDTYVSATNTTVPGDGVKITRDFQSANTTTTPSLDGKTITDRDGNALWAGAINGVHELQYASGTDKYLLLDPRPVKGALSNSIAQRDSAGRLSVSDPSIAAHAATKSYSDGLVANMVDAITDADTLTFHEAALQAVSASSYATIFDLASATELLGGAILSTSPGFRLTVDGTVVINRTSAASGEDTNADDVGVVHIPNAKAASSMKLEAFNPSGVSRNFGWRVYTR